VVFEVTKAGVCAANDAAVDFASIEEEKEEKEGEGEGEGEGVHDHHACPHSEGLGS